MANSDRYTVRTNDAMQYLRDHPSAPGAICQGSDVRPQAGVLINGIPHTVLATHPCTLPATHDPTKQECVCACGLRWTRNFK